MAAPSLLWPKTAVFPTLQPNELIVWSFLLQQPATRVRSLYALLSDEERERAGRFYFERDRDYYIVGRGVLRQAIGRFLKIPPQTVKVAYGPQGKPALHSSQASQSLQFNLTHAEGVALLAAGNGEPLGVDVEAVRKMEDMERVAHYSFSAREYGIFMETPTTQKPQTFFNCWTRKEAFIKAVGEGLSYPLAAFEVTLRPERETHMVEVKGSTEEAAKWMLRHLVPAEGFVGALAVRQQVKALHCWQWAWGE